MNRENTLNGKNVHVYSIKVSKRKKKHLKKTPKRGSLLHVTIILINIREDPPSTVPPLKWVRYPSRMSTNRDNSRTGEGGGGSAAGN